MNEENMEYLKDMEDKADRKILIGLCSFLGIVFTVFLVLRHMAMH